MKASPALIGIVLMFIGISCLSSMDAGVKWLLNNNISVIEIIAIRGWMIISVLLIALPKQGGWQALKTQHLKLHLIRTVVGFFAPFLFFISLKYLPLADATAIFFCTTFFMTAGSKLFLGEQIGLHRWGAVIVGFFGVVLVASPNTDNFQPAAILPLFAGAAYAVILLIGRVLTRTDAPFKLVFYFNLVNTLIASAALPFFWVMPTLEQLLMLLLVSGFALCGYFCLSNALRLAPISVISPIEYVALIWSTLFGYLFWDEIPVATAWLGMGIILSAGLYIMWREARKAQ